MPSSRGLSQTRDWTQVSCIAGGFFTIWATREAREYWSGQPIPSPVDLPDPGIELGSPALQVDSLPAELPGKPSISSLQHHRWITVYRVTPCPGTTLWGVWVQWYALEEKTAWMWWSLMIFTTAWNSSQPSSPETFFFCPHLDLLSLLLISGFPGGVSGKEPTYQCRKHKRLKSGKFKPWVRKIPWRKKWQPSPVLCPWRIPWTKEPGGL